MSGRSRQFDRCPQALQSPLAVYAMARHASPDVPTVLLVENVQDDRAMYAEYLRLLRFRVIGIGAARPPYRQAATADLVVTGIRVPGPYDGVELIRQLREATDTRRMPVIVLTACAFESDQLRAQQAGCDLFLSCRNPACLTRWLVPFAASSCCVPPGASVSCARSRPCGRRKIRRSGRYSRGALLNCAFTVCACAPPPRTMVLARAKVQAGRSIRARPASP